MPDPRQAARHKCLLPHRLVKTPRILPRIVPRQRVSLGPRPPADLHKLAPPALALLPQRVPQSAKQSPIPINRRQRTRPHIPRRNGQKTTRINLPRMRYEHKPVTLTHARGPEPVVSTVFAPVRPLRQESSIVHRLRRLHLKRSHLRNPRQKIKHTLILLRRQLRNRPQTVYISPHHRRLDLRIQPNFPSMPQRPQPSGKRPAHTSKTIMRCGIRPIQTDRHARYPAFLEPVNRLCCQQRSRRRRHIRSQAKPHRIPNQLIKFRSLQRIPPAQHHQRIAETPNLVKQLHAFPRAQLCPITAHARRHPTMRTSQIARLRHFLNHQQRRCPKVHLPSSYALQNAISWPSEKSVTTDEKICETPLWLNPVNTLQSTATRLTRHRNESFRHRVVSLNCGSTPVVHGGFGAT